MSAADAERSKDSVASGRSAVSFSFGENWKKYLSVFSSNETSSGQYIYRPADL